MKYFERNKRRFDWVVNLLFFTGIALYAFFFVWTIYDLEKTEERLTETIAEQAQLIEKQDAIITRDNVIISRMLLENEDIKVTNWWDRDLPVYSRWYIISNGEKVRTFTQHPDSEKFYQLNF